MPTVLVHTRWDDCDRNGHVNNAAYVALVRDALGRAHPGLALGPLAEFRIEYRAPLPPEAEVGVEVERAPTADGLLAVRFVLRAGDTVAAEAAARWRVAADARAPSLPPLADDAGGRPFAFTHEVGPADVGVDDTVRPERVLQLLEHAIYRAARLVGWDLARMRDADFITLQIGHHLVVDAGAGIGDLLSVSSRIVEMRRVRGTWHHEVRRADGAMVAADRSRGAFLDRRGRPRRPPEDMIAALLAGEDAARGRR